jgi:hypothetical protein
MGGKSYAKRKAFAIMKIIHNEGMLHVAGHLPASDGGGRKAAYRYE